MDATVSMFYKVKNSDMFNFEDGYISISIDFRANFHIDLKKKTNEQRKDIADMCNVPEENVISISRQEYEECTENE